MYYVDFALLKKALSLIMGSTGILLFVFCAALQCIICLRRALQISDHFSILCYLGMENSGLHEVELTN